MYVDKAGFFFSFLGGSWDWEFFFFFLQVTGSCMFDFFVVDQVFWGFFCRERFCWWKLGFGVVLNGGMA